MAHKNGELFKAIEYKMSYSQKLWAIWAVHISNIAFRGSQKPNSFKT